MTPNVVRPTLSRLPQAQMAAFDRKIASAIDKHGPAGFLKQAAQDVLPTMIQEVREYASVTRRFVLTHGYKDEGIISFLDDKKNPVVQYVRDLGAYASVLTLDEQPKVHVLDHPEVLNVALLSIASEIGKIHEQRVLTERYGYLDRFSELAGWRIAAKEDTFFKNSVDTIISTTPAQRVNATSDAKVTRDHLADLWRAITRNNLTPVAYLMTETRLADFMDNFGFDDFDDQTRRSVLLDGPLRQMFGIPFIIAPSSERPEERVWKDDQIYAFAAPQHVGRMPILQDLMTQVSDKIDEKFEYSAVAREYYGMAIVKNTGIARLDLKPAV